MRLSPADVTKVRTAAALHDVGKIHTPREILNKPGRLTDAEFALVQRHPGDGADMLVGIEDPEITAMVRHHHERLDGAGYPAGLTGQEIPLGARIIAVADTFDSITSSRPYRKAAKHKQALDVLSREAGSQLDAAAVAAFLEYYRGRRSVAWLALMTTGPYRLLTWLGGSTQSIGAGIAQVPALGVAALLAVSPRASQPRPGSPHASDPRAPSARFDPVRRPPHGGAGAGPRARLPFEREQRSAGASAPPRHAVREGAHPVLDSSEAFVSPSELAGTRRVALEARQEAQTGKGT